LEFANKHTHLQVPGADKKLTSMSQNSSVDEDGLLNVGEILAEDLDDLAFFKSNSEDPYFFATVHAKKTLDAE
jgi:hypothetical protein